MLERRQMGQIKELIDTARTRAEYEATKIGEKFGKSIATPVASQTEIQMKAYLPWILLGLVGVVAIGGFLGVKGAGRRR